MIKTDAGLPNNCSATGKKITEGYWYAESADAAISGLGICEAEYKRRTKRGAEEVKPDDSGKTDKAEDAKK